jgi:hypothetical protein
MVIMLTEVWREFVLAHEDVTGIALGNWSLGRQKSRYESIKLVTCGDVNWTELARHRMKWRALVLSVMILGFCYQKDDMWDPYFY